VGAGRPVEHHLTVRRTARVFLVGAPVKSPRELWVCCHGYGQLAESFASALAPLAAEGRVIAVPEALSRFYLDDPAKRHGPDSPIGASWMTREDRKQEIADYLAYLDEVVREFGTRAAEVRITALGFSQGAATVCRWAAQGEVTVHRLIVWGGTLPHDLPETRGAALFKGASVTFVGGRQDRLAKPDAIEADLKTLAEQGVAADARWHDGGHSLNSALLRELGAQ
jgi:predicted esterase